MWLINKSNVFVFVTNCYRLVRLGKLEIYKIDGGKQFVLSDDGGTYVM